MDDATNPPDVPESPAWRETFADSSEAIPTRDSDPTGVGGADQDANGDARTLRRAVRKRIFGGVCGGISERFDVDVNIVRVVFVVLALVWGLGAAIYLAMWALIPRAATDEGLDASTVDEVPVRRVRWLRYALPLGVIVLGVAVLTTVHNVHIGQGLALIWLAFLIIVAVAALRTPARRFTLGRFVALAFLGLLSLLILGVGTFLLAVQVIGVPVRGGSGVKVWSPNAVAQVQHNYDGAYGESTVDLSGVTFHTGTEVVNVTQGVGVVTVDVPDNVVLYVRSHVGIGNEWTSPSGRAGYLLSGARITATTPRLDLDVQVGIGQAHVMIVTPSPSTQ